MKKIISHRGNINGPVLEKENRPSYIDCALGLGYDAEVDIRYIGGTSFWLGHDKPQYKVDNSWILKRADRIWFHCKDAAAAIVLGHLSKDVKYFCHSSDPFVLVSTGHLWVHDLTGAVDFNTIIPLLSKLDMETYKHLMPYAICTDFCR